MSPATVVTGVAAAELVLSQSIAQSMASPPRSRPNSQKILSSSSINCFSFPLRKFLTSHMKWSVLDLFLVNTSGSLCLTPLGVAAVAIVWVVLGAGGVGVTCLGFLLGILDAVSGEVNEVCICVGSGVLSSVVSSE